MGLNFTKQFNEAIETFCLTTIPREYTRRQIETMMYLRRRLIYHTPTKGTPMASYATGHARANWQVSKNRPNNRIRGSRENPAKILTEQLVRTTISSGKNFGQGTKIKGFGNNGAYERYYIFNNVHYVKFLEDGRYDSTPLGIFRISVQETFLHFASGVGNPFTAVTDLSNITNATGPL